MADARLQVIIDLQDRISAGLKKVRDNLNDIKTGFSEQAEASQKFAKGLTTSIAAIGGAAFFGIKFEAQMETVRQGLITLLGSAEKADTTIARIKEEAKRTPFEIEGLSTAVQLISSVTKDGDKAIDTILNVGEGLAAMGKGQNELDRIIINLQQIAAVGKASSLDIKQFAFAGIPIYEMLEDQTGLAGEALGDFITEGGVTFDLLTKMFDEANNVGGRFFDAYKNQTGTLTQLWSNFKDTLNTSLGTFVKQTGIFDGLKTALSFLTEETGKFFEKVTNLFLFFREHPSTLYIIAGAILGALVPAIIAATITFATFLISLAPFMLGGAIIAGIIAGIIWIVKNWEMIKAKTIEIWGAIKLFFANVWESIKNSLSSALSSVWESIKNATKPITDAFGNIWNIVKEKTIAAFEGIKDAIKGAINWIIDKINWFVQKANAIVSKGAGAVGISIPMIPEIPRLAKGGIVKRPTLAMIGENGAEAVIPLNKANRQGMGGNIINIIVNGDISGEDLIEKVGDALTKRLQLSTAIV